MSEAVQILGKLSTTSHHRQKDKIDLLISNAPHSPWECLGVFVGMIRDIYHLLRCAFCQSVSISKIVHFNIFNVVSIGNINLAVEVWELLGG